MSHKDEVSEQPKGVASTLVQSTCLNVVEQYRQGQISKGNAIYEFTKASPTGEAGTSESPGQTLKSYISMLNDWDREQTLSDTDVPGEGDGTEASTIKEDRRQKCAE
jgi:hypothetical protein